MSRGRRVPPRPIDLATVPGMETIALNPQPTELQTLLQSGELLVLQYEHYDACSAVKTRRMDDCTCAPNLRVLRRESGGAS
jgi:hypothetical protein